MNRNPNKERGSVIVISAVLLPALLFMVGLAVDFGVTYAVRNSAQTAADAAAMAGVYAYAGLNPSPLDPTGNTDAQVAFAANPFPGSGSATLTPSPGGYACTDGFSAKTGIAQKCYQVTVTTTSPTFFARVFGKQAVAITVRANAIANSGLGYGSSCVKPIFVPDAVLKCTYSGGTLSSCTLPPGSSVTIVPQTAGNCTGSNCTSALVPSDWYQLDFSSIINPANPKPDPVVFSDGTSINNSGTPTYDDSWQKCVVTAIHCGDYINVQTGGKGGNTDQDIKALLKDGTTSFIGPIWDASAVVPNGNGYQAQVVGFAQFSNLSCGSCATGAPITATYDAYLGCQAGGGGSSGVGSETGSYSTPVRLVKVQP